MVCPIRSARSWSGDRLSWRRFVGLGLQEAVPDETTLVRFRQRLREHGLHEQLLALVNRQLQTKGLIFENLHAGRTRRCCRPRAVHAGQER